MAEAAAGDAAAAGAAAPAAGCARAPACCGPSPFWASTACDCPGAAAAPAAPPLPACGCAAHARLPSLLPYLSVTEAEDRAVEAYFRVLGNDPGVGNLACVVEHVQKGEGNRFHQGPRPARKTAGREAARASGPDGAARCARTATYALTQGHFDKCTGKARRLAKAAACNRQVAAQHALLATTTRKTSYPARLGAYHVIADSVAEACQANRAQPRVRRALFTYYMLSTSVMDSFWASVRRGRARDGTLRKEAQTLLAYGAAGPDGHWRGGGPHRRLYVSAQRVFGGARVAKTDEFNTTRTHAHCGAVLSDVVDKAKNNKQRLPHGATEHSLKHCPKCSSWVDRDVNAALNILKAFIAALRVRCTGAEVWGRGWRGLVPLCPGCAPPPPIPAHTGTHARARPSPMHDPPSPPRALHCRARTAPFTF